MKRVWLVSSLAIVLFGATAAQAQVGYAIDSDGTNHLWSVDLSTGAATDLGAITGGFTQIEGLATSSAGVIYGVDDVTDTLVTIDTSTAAATAVGAGNGNLGVDVEDVGLTFDGAGNLWLSSEGNTSFYQVNPATGAATLITSSQSPDVTGLAACNTTIYGLVDGANAQLVTIDPATGAVTPVGNLGVTVSDDGGLAMGSDGVLYLVPDNNGSGPSILYTVNKATGAATAVGNITFSGDINGIEGFTTASGPPVSCDVEIPTVDARVLAAIAAMLLLIGLRATR